MKRILLTGLGMLVTIGILSLVSCGDKQPKETKRTLKIWHYESENGAMGLAWKVAMDKFKEKHPDVTIIYENKGFEQIRQTASMVLNSDDAPDIMEYNKGNASAGLLSKQGLLADLTDEANKRGWDKILSPSLQTTCKYNEQGIMGGDKWYGVTNYGEYVMVYYNKDMFKKYNLELPKTLDEFEKIMSVFLKAGVVPLVVAGAEYPAQHIFYELVLSKADRNFVNAYQLYKGNVSFKGPEMTFGAQRLLEWVRKGYIGKDSISMKAENMGVAFTNGNYPIMISGSWWYGRFMNEIKNFEWGIFSFPGNTLHPGSGGNIWVISSKSKNKDLAYDFIDITLSPEIQTILANAGGIPVNADISKITDQKIKELVEGFDTINKNDGLAFYPDWPAAGYYDTLVATIQELMGETKTIPQFLEALEKSYNENKAQ
ncbi:ABC transporter substrate-binding protein [Gracilinema caldarium]|uniref:Extracellular solute-binding protein family 1 n=1 Tax=Gracilinema caldarium (strain ATCC 51460 / DSM 7334 / H1) TaxID=744872 RepID=F8EYU4_GRAC1|nr:extracellular solute-binding protein [Gracilinema caldarium]AEJ18890.1 extracellular solute-binding protein family 1 [Gracilinema caldarium DSM 7334]